MWSSSSRAKKDAAIDETTSQYIQILKINLKSDFVSKATRSLMFQNHSSASESAQPLGDQTRGVREMRRLLLLLNRLFLICSALLISWGIWIISTMPRASNAGLIHLEAGETNFGHVKSGKSAAVELSIVNPSDLPRRLLGARQVCQAQGCVVADGLPITIPGRSTGTLRLVFHAMRPGQFVARLPVYTDCEDRSELEVRLNGYVDESPAITATP